MTRPAWRDWPPRKVQQYLDSPLTAEDFEEPKYRCENGCGGRFHNRESRDAHHARGCSWEALVAELREAM